MPWCLRLVRRPTFPGTLPLSQRVVPPLRPVCRVKAGSLPSAGDFLLRTLSSRHGSQPFQPWVKSAAHSVRYCGPPGYHFVWPNLEPMDADARIAFSILFYNKKKIIIFHGSAMYAALLGCRHPIAMPTAQG